MEVAAGEDWGVDEQVTEILRRRRWRRWCLEAEKRRRRRGRGGERKGEKREVGVGEEGVVRSIDGFMVCSKMIVQFSSPFFSLGVCPKMIVQFVEFGKG